MNSETAGKLGRRDVLKRLGLAATAAYAAPTILHLDRQAQVVQPSCTGKGKGKGNPWCKASGSKKRTGDLEDWKRNNGNRYAYGYSGDDYRRDGDRDWGRDRHWDRDRDRDRSRHTSRGYFSREKGRTRDEKSSSPGRGKFGKDKKK